jgi:hypothetical protein
MANSPTNPSAAPRIGSYSKPGGPSGTPSVTEVKKPQETPAKSLVDGAQEEMRRDVSEGKDAAARAKSYDEILSDNEISKNKASAIVDDLLTKGFYQEDIPLTSSVFLTLRTRTHADYRRYLRQLEIDSPRYIDEQHEIQMRYFVAASLVAYKGQEFAHPSHRATQAEIDELFKKRLDFVEGLPERVVALIASKLAKFDRVVQIVMSEGVVENF